MSFEDPDPPKTRRRFLQTSGLALGSAAVAARADNTPDSTMKSEESLNHLVNCLGGPWPEPCPLNFQLKDSVQKDGYRIETITFDAEPGDAIPAHLLIPDSATADAPAPAVAVWHQHGGQYHLGKSEPAGLAGDPMHHTGLALTRLGYVTLCPDALCFEERQDPEGMLAGGKYERYEFLRYIVEGKCMAWKNILDMKRAIDLLVSRPEVDSERLGCYGHSMGSTHTWLVGPHEPRLKALVGNCCLPTYEAIHQEKILHCFPNFVPGWKPFGDTPEMAALIAPRALHLNLGENDGGSPIAEAKAGVERIRQAYADLQKDENFSAFIEPETGHVLSPEMWKRTKEFFAKHLG